MESDIKRIQENSQKPTKMKLREVLEVAGKDFPVVVRTCETDNVYELTNDEDHRLPPKTLMRLNAVKKIPFAHVRVLELDDENDAVEQKGQDHATEYNEFVGKEFLIPLNLPHKVNVVHRPRRPRRYAVAEQIMQDRPRYLKAETDTRASSGSTPKTEMIPAGTTLELSRVIARGYENVDILELRDSSNGETYMLRHDDRVNFTVVADRKHYTLADLVTSVPLPAPVKFIDNISPSEVSLDDDQCASIALHVTNGVLEAVGKTVITCAVGSIQHRPVDGKEGVTKTVIIPETVFDKETVMLKKFPTHLQRDHFCQSNFESYDRDDFLFSSLYFMRPYALSVTFLRCSGAVTKEDIQDYIKPFPAVPPVVPPKPNRSSSFSSFTDSTPLDSTKLPQRILHPDAWKRVIEKTKLGFGKVHKELLSRAQKSANFIRSFQRQISLPHKTETDEASSLRSARGHRPMQRSVSDSDTDPRLDHGAYRDRPLPTPPIGARSDRVRASDGYLIMCHRDAVRDKINATKLTNNEIQKIQRQNQTREDFKKYNVKEVYECLRLAGLKDMAEKCLENRLDGQFLLADTFDLKSLKKAPFLQTDFQIVKIEKVIDGWRPNLNDC